MTAIDYQTMTYEELSRLVDDLTDELKRCKRTIKSLKALLDKGLAILTYVDDVYLDERIFTTVYTRKTSYKYKRHRDY